MSQLLAVEEREQEKTETVKTVSRPSKHTRLPQAVGKQNDGVLPIFLPFALPVHSCIKQKKFCLLTDRLFTC